MCCVFFTCVMHYDVLSVFWQRSRRSFFLFFFYRFFWMIPTIINLIWLLPTVAMILDFITVPSLFRALYDSCDPGNLQFMLAFFIILAAIYLINRFGIFLYKVMKHPFSLLFKLASLLFVILLVIHHLLPTAKYISSSIISTVSALPALIISFMSWRDGLTTHLAFIQLLLTLLAPFLPALWSRLPFNSSYYHW